MPDEESPTSVSHLSAKDGWDGHGGFRSIICSRPTSGATLSAGLVRLATRLTGSVADGEDLAQDVL